MSDWNDRADSGDKDAGLFAIAIALNNMAETIDKVAAGIRALGTNDAASSIGAVELLATEVRDAGEKLADAILAGE